MKQSETESNWRFRKNLKNKSSKPEIVSDATFKTWPFSSNFNFTSKDGRVTAGTCKYYCPLVLNRTITNYCKVLYLKSGGASGSAFESFTMYEN